MNAITNPEHIKQFRMLALLSGLKLETLGMRTRGRSCYQIVKAEFGLNGNRRQVLEQYTALIDQLGIKRGGDK